MVSKVSKVWHTDAGEYWPWY